MLSAQEFVRKWQDTTLRERQSYQLHFIDVCHLVGHEPPSPDGVDSKGRQFAFDYGLKKDLGGQGFADVFYEEHFGMEYKGEQNGSQQVCKSPLHRMERGFRGEVVR